jgi:hypothetical protein
MIIGAILGHWKIIVAYLRLGVMGFLNVVLNNILMYINAKVVMN